MAQQFSEYIEIDLSKCLTNILIPYFNICNIPFQYLLYTIPTFFGENVELVSQNC
jgi:hypothetical protein